MNQEDGRIFYAKVLLFGEYTIIKGSDALAAPLPLFGGRWAFLPAGKAGEEQQQLFEFCAYLEGLDSAEGWTDALDTGRFRRELTAGLYFASNIPTGYGLGSSGALCAAVFHRYGQRPDKEADLPLLRRTLARIEGFFHGSSSGTDPLICYLGRPLKLHADGRIESVDLPAPAAPFSFFLLDTGIPRQTGPLVQLFLKKWEEEIFQRTLAESLVPATHEAIERTIAGDWAKLAGAFRQISTLQIQHFSEMIPPPFQSVWREGLATNGYYLKLCGAGGGGFLLGCTFDWEKTQHELRDYSLQPI